MMNPQTGQAPVRSPQLAMELQTGTGCVNLGSLVSTLPVIPYQKLTDLYYLSRGGFGTVFKAQHSDWRTTVAIKCLKLDSPFGEKERNSLLKEAEVLHKARFNYIIQIFGVCNEPEFFCIVTEFMSNGSLDLLLHETDMYPELAWPLRLRILYEIALGVNYLHHMNPPLLHQDLKTQNILLDGEYHVKIADFGLSKWRHLSLSKASGSKPTEMGGTVIYMPPEKYDPSANNRSRRADVKHDMYSYAIIMWEVLSRQIPYDEMNNPMQIMFSVIHGTRPDTSLDSLPAHIPNKEVLLNLITSGWSANPDERPTFLKCLVELEPMLRSFDDIDFLEAVLDLKRSKRRAECCSTSPPISCPKRSDEDMRCRHNPMERPPSGSGSCSSPETELSLPHILTSKLPEGLPPSFIPPDLPGSLKSFDPSTNNLNGRQSPEQKFNIPVNGATSECSTKPDNTILKPQMPECCSPPRQSPPLRGPMEDWIATRREEIVLQMTDACLYQTLDTFIAQDLIMQEDYELVVNQLTRTAKVRKLLDNCHRHNEDFCRIVVSKLYFNKQMGLKPYPPEIASFSPAGPSASDSMSRNT
ncbi:receptor-interacting serine/threonine-protein kinase 2-like [Eucyclogobius newberryi]|uniref:receptor-interacting serine/threonine-protein kinase 2-like n=1 Tax=Eucyclogobius newberryi TaxID=166745 RepID=UPI003B590CB9